MKRNRGATIGIGIAFGFITFTIMVFLVPPQLALNFGIFTALMFILVLSLMMDKIIKRYENVDNFIEGEIHMKDTANYYFGKLICNGVLYATSDKLIFISYEKKPIYRKEIPFTTIKRATFGKVFRHVRGLKLIMIDSTVKGFAIEDVELFLEHINKYLAPDLFDESETP